MLHNIQNLLFDEKKYPIVFWALTVNHTLAFKSSDVTVIT
jgi:hypothetical protein